MKTHQLTQTYFTKKEAAEYTRHSLRTLDFAVRKRQLRAFNPSRKLLFLKSDLDAWVQNCQPSEDLNCSADESSQQQ